MGEQSQNVDATQTSFEILEEMKGSGPTSISELSRRLNKPKSTIHRHLSTLAEMGYIQQKATHYKLGLRLLDLGEHARIQHPLYSVVKPEVDDIVRDNGERAQVMVEEDNLGVYIYQQVGEKAIMTDSHIGKRVHLHSVASGKAYLAFLPDERVHEIINDVGLPAITTNTITDQETFFESLEEIRDRGHAFNDEEEMGGIRAVGAPILNDNDGSVVGSVSFAAPTTRLHGEFFRETIPDRLKEIATVLGIKATYK